MYRGILDQAPNHVDATLLLGVVALQRNNFEAAAVLLSQAAKLAPGHLYVHSYLGTALLNLRRYDDALASFDRALALDPSHAEVLNNRGIVLRSLKRQGEALASYDRAIAAHPSYAEAFNNRGNLLRELGRPEAALASYDRAITIKPAYPEALHSRGGVLRDLNRPEQALASFEQLLAISPGHVEALIDRGNILQLLHREQEALECFDRVLTLEPDFAKAHYYRGNILFALGRHDDALASFDQSLQINAEDAGAWNNRGAALLSLGRVEEALGSVDRALAIMPIFAKAHYYRGNILFALGRHEDAVASFDQALRGTPEDAEAWNNRSAALLCLGRPEEALASVENALAIMPDYAAALTNSGSALLALKQPEAALARYDKALLYKPGDPETLANRGLARLDMRRHEEAARDFERLLTIQPNFDYARGWLVRAKLDCCDWSNYGESIESIVSEVSSGNKRVIPPFHSLSVSGVPSLLLNCARIYSEHRYPAAKAPIWRGERYGHDKIRIAYLSADFCDHATSFLMADLFENHDRSRFEITTISFGPESNSEFGARLKRSFSNYFDVRDRGDHAVAGLIRELEIDIAVDLKGYTKDSRPGILAHRPAPVQVNYLGFPGTMGNDYIDYIIADRIVIPEDHHAFYTEKIVSLPDTYQCNDPQRKISRITPTRQEVGLPETGFVFCAFNNNYKITPQLFEIWMRLLHKVEGSTLWLLQPNAAAQRNLQQSAAKHGIAPERLVFAPHTRPDEHLARHRLADLLLDNLPYGAHTTASDALWAGLPVLTCLGSSFAGRVAASLLRAAGLPELIATDLAEYEAKALALAQDRVWHAAIKAKLSRNRDGCPLFDADRFRRHIESAYQTMWQRYERGEPPVAFTVGPYQRKPAL